MIRDKQAYFNIDMRNVSTVPKQFIDAIEQDLGSIMAQTPAEDKLELYLKYHLTATDRNATKGVPQPPSNGGNLNIEALFDDFHSTLNNIDQRLSKLEDK
jgi:hypothetical protein